MRHVRTFICAWVCATLIASAVGCGKQKTAGTAEDDPVLATVDGREIRASDFVAEYEKVPGEQRAYYLEHRDELLGFIVNRYLIVAEAQSAGLDTDPEVVGRLEEARRFASEQGLDESEELAMLMREAKERILILVMRERVLAEIETTITEEELRALAAEASGGDLPKEFFELSGIVTADRTKTEQARAELVAGTPFDDVHAAYSPDRSQHLGTYSDTTIDQMPEVLREAIEGLEDGGLSEVIEMDGEFVVVQLTRRPAIVDLEPWRKQLLARRQDEHFLRWTNAKRGEHRIMVNTERLNQVKLP